MLHPSLLKVRLVGRTQTLFPVLPEGKPLIGQWTPAPLHGFFQVDISLTLWAKESKCMAFSVRALYSVGFAWVGSGVTTYRAALAPRNRGTIWHWGARRWPRNREGRRGGHGRSDHRLSAGQFSPNATAVYVEALLWWVNRKHIALM